MADIEQPTPPADDVREPVDGAFCEGWACPHIRERDCDSTCHSASPTEAQVTAAHCAYNAARGFDSREWIRAAITAALNA